MLPLGRPPRGLFSWEGAQNDDGGDDDGVVDFRQRRGRVANNTAEGVADEASDIPAEEEAPEDDGPFQVEADVASNACCARRRNEGQRTDLEEDDRGTEGLLVRRRREMPRWNSDIAVEEIAQDIAVWVLLRHSVPWLERLEEEDRAEEEEDDDNRVYSRDAAAAGRSCTVEDDVLAAVADATLAVAEEELLPWKEELGDLASLYCCLTILIIITVV